MIVILSSLAGRGLRRSSHGSIIQGGFRNQLVTLNRSPKRFLISKSNSESPLYSRAVPLNIILGVFSLAATSWAVYERTERLKTKPESSSATEETTASQPQSSSSSIAPTHLQKAPQWDLSPTNLAAAQADFTALLGPKGLTTDLPSRIAHSSTQWSESPHGPLDRPSMIVYPRSTADVSAIARICHARRIPMIAFSGGTSLEGALAACNQEVCIDFSRMDGILKVNADDMDAVVQPGVEHGRLNEVLGQQELFFPPDPGPGACIGGMVAQGCSGPNAYRYGTMREWVLGLTVVLADGTVISTRARPKKSSAGYDLTRLFVGSEGTLGIVTEARIRLAAKPKNVRVAVASFPDIQKAVRTSVGIAKSGYMLAAMELLDDWTMRAVNNYCDTTWPEETTLFFKFAGSEGSVAEQIEAAKRIAGDHGCTSFTASQNDEELESLWMARKTALWSLLAMKAHPDDKFLSADTCVPVSRLGDFITLAKQSFEKYGLIGCCLGHVGDGNIHTSVLYNESEKDVARALIRETQKLGTQMEGTVSGEHGIGLENRDALVWELGEDTVAAMRQIKRALDPCGLLNPGKVFRLWERQE